MGVCMRVRSKRRVRTSVLLSPEVYQKIRRLADRNDASNARVIRQALQTFLEGKSSQTNPLLEIAGPAMAQKSQ